MKSFVSAFAIVCLASSSALAQEANVRSALAETFVMAQACRAAQGADWEPIVADAWSNLEAFLVDGDEPMAKVDLDVTYAELTEQAKDLPVSNELTEYCHNVMAYGG